MIGVTLFAQTGYGETVSPTVDSGPNWPLLFMVSAGCVALAVAMTILAARLFVGSASGGSVGAAAIAALASAVLAWWAASRGFDGVSALPEGLSYLSGVPSMLYTLLFVVAVVLGVLGGRSLARSFA